MEIVLRLLFVVGVTFMLVSTGVDSLRQSRDLLGALSISLVVLVPVAHLIKLQMDMDKIKKKLGITDKD